MKRLLLLLVLVASGLAGCAAHQRLNTPSGNPEATFISTDVESVKGKIASGCASNGLNIFEMTSNQVIAGKTLSGKDAFLAQLIVGNSYSTQPVQKVSFILFQQGKDVKVTARQWIESQMAYGQLRQQELTSSEQMQGLQNFLSSLGGS